MHLLHPWLPLTESGRVLVCVAAALFASLLVVAWSPADADTAAAPITCARAAR